MKSEKEVWEPILMPNVGGFYLISTHGRVKNKHGLIRKQSKNRRGYFAVTFKNKGVSKRAEIHRLVAWHFINNKEGYPVVNHIDSDKENNNLSNLEWCTYQQNTHHAAANGRFINNSREPCKIGILGAVEIRNKYKTGRYTQRQLAAEYGVYCSTINQILTNKSYKNEKIK